MELTHNIIKMPVLCSRIALHLRHCSKKGPNNNVPCGEAWIFQPHRKQKTKTKKQKGDRDSVFFVLFCWILFFSLN